ncbi:hypothetical protein ABFX02_03G042900 [Erythranthe guttata]
MKGQMNLSFDHGSTSSSSNDAVIDSHIPWNNTTMQNPPQNLLPNYRTPSNEPINNTQYLPHLRNRNEGRVFSEWSFGESSSAAPHHHHHRHQELPYPLDNANLNASNGLPQDLNMSSGFENQEDNECRIIGSSNEQTGTSVGPTNPLNYEYTIDESRRMTSCKRKAENSNSNSNYQNTNGGAEVANPRLVIGGGGGGGAVAARRNFRLRINGFQMQQQQQDQSTLDNPFLTTQVSSSSRLAPTNPAHHAVENGSFLSGQSVLLQASSSSSARRNHQSRWSGASSSRNGGSYEEEPASRNIPGNIPRSISEHPMFVPAGEIGNSSSMNWSLGGNNNINNNNNNSNNNNNGINGNVASSSRVGPSSRGANAGPSWNNRSCPQYPRRLSEIVRRSLTSSAVRLNSAATSQETALPVGPDNRGSNLRSGLLGRNIDAAFGVPYSLRALAAAGEGRTTIMSEQIRHVLDLMRRGEGLRFEDMMMLDHSVLFGMADIHDRHRDMRLDVDNMSYEELLALEDRIGNVCTGLNEITIKNRLKQRKYVERQTQDQVETEPCSICREEYKDNEDLGTLECGHDFHKDCISQWLMQKNICPICKTTGLKT